MAHDETALEKRSIDVHLKAAASLANPQITTGVELSQAVGTVLATEVVARRAVPPFNNSAVDGFVVRATDLNGTGPWELPVHTDIPAGSLPRTFPAGSCARIMTGAPLPDIEGLVVVPVENTNIERGPRSLPESVTINRVNFSRANIRKRGSNIDVGDSVADPGTRIDAGSMAALLSAGINSVDVYRQPMVAVISTGDELTTGSNQASEYQTPNSNLPMVSALARANGAATVHEFHTGDSAEDFLSTLNQATEVADLVVTSGGISVGAFDVVRAVTEGSDAMWFGGVAQKPGTPQGLGTWNGTPLICLPGNPVATWVSFHLYVAPLINTSAGLSAPKSVTDRPRLTAIFNGEIPAPAKGSTLVVPVRLDYSGDQVLATAFSTTPTGSHHVGSLADTDGLAIIEADHDSNHVTVLQTRS